MLAKKKFARMLVSRCILGVGKQTTTKPKPLKGGLMSLFKYRDCWYLVNFQGDLVESGSKQKLVRLARKNKYLVKEVG